VPPAPPLGPNLTNDARLAAITYGNRPEYKACDPFPDKLPPHVGICHKLDNATDAHNFKFFREEKLLGIHPRKLKVVGNYVYEYY
jgi:hypothetical protein